MIHPYRLPPAATARAPRASWWRNAWRLWRVQRAWQVHGWTRFLGTMAVAFAVWQVMRVAFSPTRGSALELAAAVLSWPVADMLLGRLRLRRVRRAMRRSEPEHDNCPLCGTDDPRARSDCACCLAASAEECSANCPRGRLTTFPALAAYRELARTGDVEAFAARDTRPVTVEYTLQAMDDDGAEALNAARRAQVAAEEVSEMLKERAPKVIVSRRVITPPGAAIEVIELELSDEARAGLQVRRETLGDVM